MKIRELEFLKTRCAHKKHLKMTGNQGNAKFGRFWTDVRENGQKPEQNGNIPSAGFVSSLAVDSPPCRTSIAPARRYWRSASRVRRASSSQRPKGLGGRNLRHAAKDGTVFLLAGEYASSKQHLLALVISWVLRSVVSG